MAAARLAPLPTASCVSELLSTSLATWSGSFYPGAFEQLMLIPLGITDDTRFARTQH
jgi:hypothetical protein